MRALALEGMSAEAKRLMRKAEKPLREALRILNEVPGKLEDEGEIDVAMDLALARDALAEVVDTRLPE